MRIPTCEEQSSMNLGQAVAVCLYELVRNAKLPRQPIKEELATAGEAERITVALLETLRLTGYTNLGSTASTEEKVRRLVRHLSLPARDSEVWLGILRQILWKVRSGEVPPVK
jgi:tRNA/rRNA methyltransferase